jgi:hypothetical protein
MSRILVNTLMDATEVGRSCAQCATPAAIQALSAQPIFLLMPFSPVLRMSVDCEPCRGPTDGVARRHLLLLPLGPHSDRV